MPHILISPTHVLSVNPNVSIKCLHLSPPLSFFLKYRNSFCLRCTNNLRFRAFTLSLRPRVSRKSASVLIFAVKIAICTSLLPVSGPTRGVVVVVVVVVVAVVPSAASASKRSEPRGDVDTGFGRRYVSVLCRPNVSIQRWMFARVRSALLALVSAVSRCIASTAVSCSSLWARDASFSRCGSLVLRRDGRCSGALRDSLRAREALRSVLWRKWLRREGSEGAVGCVPVPVVEVGSAT